MAREREHPNPAVVTAVGSFFLLDDTATSAWPQHMKQCISLPTSQPALRTIPTCIEDQNDLIAPAVHQQPRLCLKSSHRRNLF